MMSEQDLADVVQIAVDDLTPDNPGTVLPTDKVEITPERLFFQKSKVLIKTAS